MRRDTKVAGCDKVIEETASGAKTDSIIEPLSLDEAYLDVTENLQGIPLARDVALRIREKINAETGLNASAGISYNKFLAKLASDHRKPNGQYVISPEMGPARLRSISGAPAGRNLRGKADQEQETQFLLPSTGERGLEFGEVRPAVLHHDDLAVENGLLDWCVERGRDRGEALRPVEPPSGSDRHPALVEVDLQDRCRCSRDSDLSIGSAR
jgi:impB/mucB/samB family